MKKFTIEVKHASQAQLLTIAAELKIMSNEWVRYGPEIKINDQKLQAPKLRVSRQEEKTSTQKANSNITTPGRH